MKNFIIYNAADDILRTGLCQDVDFEIQAHANEFVMEGEADAVTQKIVEGEVVNKTPAEIEAEKPPEPEPVPIGQQQANITNEQWQDVLKKLKKLEKS